MMTSSYWVFTGSFQLVQTQTRDSRFSKIFHSWMKHNELISTSTWNKAMHSVTCSVFQPKMSRHRVSFWHSCGKKTRLNLWRMMYFKELVKLGCHDSCESASQRRKSHPCLAQCPPQPPLKHFMYLRKHQCWPMCPDLWFIPAWGKWFPPCARCQWWWWRWQLRLH